MNHTTTASRSTRAPVGPRRSPARFPLLVACGLLLGAIHAGAVTVKVDSTKPWIGWMNLWQTNGTSYVSGNSWYTPDLPATFVPANIPGSWPLNTQLVLRPNTSSYNPADPFWNFPDGSPNKILQAIFYVDVFNAFGGQTVTFSGSVGSNSIPQGGAALPRGSIGLGSWNTGVEYTNVVVTSNGVTLYQSDFVNQGAAGWSVYRGTWGVSAGRYRQTAITTDCRSTTGNTNWSDYTITLRARKISGSEGFLILFHWRNNNNWTWWNVGGWNNTLHAIEQSTGGSKRIVGGQTSGSIAFNTWYDLRIELNGPRIRCYLNDSLVHDVDYPASDAPATRWETLAFVKEFTTSYGYIGETTVPLRPHSPFTVSRAIAPGNVCQYGFTVTGPNTAPGSANAMTGAGIFLEDPDPLITSDPYGGTITPGTITSLFVTAVGSTALNYQWKRNGTNLTNGGNISGANTATLTISNAQLSDSGNYTVTVRDDAGSATSQVATLTVLCVLASEQEPFVIQNIAAGTNGSFSLVWDSCGSHLYEIQASIGLADSNGWTPRDLVIGGNGATIWAGSNPPDTDWRFYRVQRFSFHGDQDGDRLSNLAEFNHGTGLHNRDSDDDQFPDGWEVQFGFDPLVATDGSMDSDGDGYSDLQEFQLHTRPDASYSQPVHVPQGLVAWWKMDEAAGTNVFDSSLNGRNGYVLGNNPTAAWTTGYLSNGVTLGGSANNWIEVPYRPILTPAQELTFMGWVRPTGQGVLIGNWNSAAEFPGNYLLQFGPDAIDLSFSPAADGSGAAIHFNPGWTTNDWHHIAVCYSHGTNVAVFVDGEWRAGQSVTGSYLPTTNSVLIGFPGLTNACAVDDVRVYNRALATNEIAVLSQGNGLPAYMIVGQTATLRAFGAAESGACQWSIVSGQGFFTNVAGVTAEFRPSWSGAVTVQAVWESEGVFHTNLSSTVASFPNRSPLSEWNDGGQVQFGNNCYNFATDIRTDTIAQPGGPPFYFLYTCEQQINAAISDGLQAGVDLVDLCHSSGLPEGHIAALLILPPMLDFHWVRMEADGTWSSKAGGYPATTLDNAGQPITDPRTANWQTIFGSYQFCGFFWVGPDVNILHYPQ